MFLFLLSFSFFLFTCEANDPPPPENGNGTPEAKITLTVDDTSPTEVWLNVTTENIELPNEFKLLRNNDTTQTIKISDSSTVLYEDSLLPSQSYTYQLSSIQQQVSSNQITAVTMDTTSHSFTWEVYEFGEHGNSVLKDVAIIDENNIWAVGAIYLNDSTGQSDSKLYNVVHWDGSQWEVKRATVNYNGNLINVEGEGIIAFSATDIWLVGSLPIHGDGENWEIIDVREITNSDLSLSKVWGTSSSDLYFVGRGGSIAHYNGTSWSKIESGAELTLSDVYGSENDEVYASGVNSSTISGILLQGNSGGFSTLKSSEIIDTSELFEKLYGELSSVWVDEKGTVYTGGNLLYWNRRGEWNYVTNLPENYIGGNVGTYYRGFINSIRGNSSNDYVISGDRNTLRHYNGISWKQLGMEYDPSSSYNWYEVEQKDNTIVAVGRNGSKAIIVKLKR